MEQIQGQSDTKPCYKSRYKTLIIQVIFRIFFASAQLQYSPSAHQISLLDMYMNEEGHFSGPEFKHFLC